MAEQAAQRDAAHVAASARANAPRLIARRARGWLRCPLDGACAQRLAGDVVTIVDIIVPVQSRAEAPRRCIESVLAAANVRTPYELIVVNDAIARSPSSRALRDLGRRSA